MSPRVTADPPLVPRAAWPPCCFRRPERGTRLAGGINKHLCETKEMPRVSHELHSFHVQVHSCSHRTAVHSPPPPLVIITPVPAAAHVK